MRASPPSVPAHLAPHLSSDDVATAARFLPSGNWLLVADPDTHAALGKRVSDVSPNATLHLLPARPKPTIELAEQIARIASECTALIAVGSGTINDLVKYAAYQGGKPYLVLPTAPSMNGYVSANASIIRDNQRVTLPAASPQAVLCDLGVLAAAPVRLIRAGIGDSLCRSTAQADWLLSHHLLETPYDERPFALLAPYEASLIAQASRAVEGDPAAIELLMRMLLASGEGMRLAGGSYPASQGEHMIAHTLGMMGHDNGHHGEQIAVTTVTMAKIQARYLSREQNPVLDRYGERQWLIDVFGDVCGKSLDDASAEKREAITRLLDSGTLPDRWNTACRAIKTIAAPVDDLDKALQAAGCPIEPSELGWTAEDYGAAVELAANTRDRFTFLDLH